VERETRKVVFLHTPKTGGAAMVHFFYDQLKTVRRNYFLSFTGWDDSRFFDDELVTRRPHGNKCVIESIFADLGLVRDFERSRHFQQAKVLFGHATFALGDLFPQYEFEYLTVLREPVERAISNIAQLSGMIDGKVKFGAQTADCERFTEPYWDFIYDVLVKEYPVRGLMLHENLYLRNAMTRVLQGDRYLDVHGVADVDLALDNARRIRISFFDEYNAGLQRSLDALGIPVDMSRNVRAEAGTPAASVEKAAHGRFYNAPQRVIDFVIEHNQADIALFEALRAPAAAAPPP
jgi:hypothetical protein